MRGVPLAARHRIAARQFVGAGRGPVYPAFRIETDALAAG
jgi:hypothetical protein